VQPPKSKPPQPKPPELEPEKPLEIKPEIKPEKVKPKLPEDLIRSLQEKLKITPTRKPEPTRSSQPTPQPAVKATPTRTPRPTRTPIPTIPNMIPLEQLENPSSAIAQAKSTPVHGASSGLAGITPPGVGALSPGSPGAGGMGPAGNGMGGLEIAGEGGYDFSSYGYTLSFSLRRNWRPPTIRPPEKKDYSAVVSFSVAKNGSISEIRIVESSGWLVLDRTVEEAVQRSNPFVSLPLTYTSGSVQVKVRFVLPKN
jgi:protein TonB